VQDGEKEFYEKLAEFMSSNHDANSKKAQTIKERYMSCLPTHEPKKGIIWKNKPIDLFALFQVVQNAGGYDAVELSNAWRKVAKESAIEKATAKTARDWYQKHLLAFEPEYNAENEARADIEKKLENVVADECDDVSDRSSSISLQNRFKGEAQFLLNKVLELKRNQLPGDRDVLGDLTRPLEEKLSEFLRAMPAGQLRQIVAMGENGIGKSLLFDLLLRAGCATHFECV
jgi:ATPase subunit of ABC transporter with duplicated ATPase domains